MSSAILGTYCILMQGLPTGLEAEAAHAPDWMGHLDAAVTLSQLVFPGTHDSLAYGAAGPALSDSLPEWFKHLHWLPGLQVKIERWACAQQGSLRSQLHRGIRSLDLRVTLGDNGKMHGQHTFLFADWEGALRELADFLAEFPKEVVLVQYRSGAPECDRRLLDVLGPKLLPGGVSTKHLSLQELRDGGHQVLLTSTGPGSGPLAPYLHLDLVHHHWLDTFSADQKAQHLRSRLSAFSPESPQLFNLDWTVTPQPWDVAVDTGSLLSAGACMNHRLPRFLASLPATDLAKISVISVDAADSVDLLSIIQKFFCPCTDKPQKSELTTKTEIIQGEHSSSNI